MKTVPQRNNTVTWLAIYFAILTVTTFLGLVVGGIYHQFTTPIYRSEATVLLDESLEIQEGEAIKQHALQISDPKFVESTLTANKLYKLRCFDNASTEQAVKGTVANLEVEQNASVPSMFKVRFSGSRPDDAQTILNNLLSSFREKVEKIKFSPSSEPTESQEQSASEATTEEEAELAFVRHLQESGRIPAYSLEVLEPPIFGDPIWPVLPLILAVTGFIGLLAGVAIVASIFLFSRSLAKRPTADPAAKLKTG